MIGLERHRRLTGDIVFPSRAKVAKLTGLSNATVKRTIAKLVRRGLITRQKRFREDGAQTSNAYNLDPLWEKLAGFTLGSSNPPPGSHRPGGDLANPTKAHSDPGGLGHTDPGPWVTVPKESRCKRSRCIFRSRSS